MSDTIRQIGGVHFINARGLWKSVEGVPVENRLRAILHASGVSFFDEHHDFVKCPQVGIVGIGGIPIVWEDSLENNKIALSTAPQVGISPKDISESLLEMAVFGGYNSYLNSNDKSCDDFIEVLLDNKHYSTTHMLVLNIMILGVSLSVENEFNCQRDIVHLARLTEARTKAQNNPPICVLYPELLMVAQDILNQCRSSASDFQSSTEKITKDRLEASNIMFPAAKATLFTITGSIRNLLKLTSLLGDAGKEEEMKRILTLLNNSLNALFPKIFPPTESYDYRLPEHLYKKS